MFSQIPRCSYYANAFSLNSNVEQEAFSFHVKCQPQLFDTNKMFITSTKMKIQQIKHDWGWCHSHKIAWKLEEHASTTRTVLFRILFLFFYFFHFSLTENVQQFLHWRLIFSMVFQHEFQALSLIFQLEVRKTFSTAKWKKDVVWKSAFCRISLQYHSVLKTDETFTMLGLNFR